MAPMSLQTSFAMITKKRHPEAAKRGRLFETAMMRLTEWWYGGFFDIEGGGHIRSRTFDEAQEVLFEVDFEDTDGEVIRSPKSLMKHALQRRGSRDVSSQLFTALCRALDIPARLVVSLQSVPWQAHVGKHKSRNRRKGKKERMTMKARLRQRAMTMTIWRKLLYPYPQTARRRTRRLAIFREKGRHCRDQLSQISSAKEKRYQSML